MSLVCRFVSKIRKQVASALVKARNERGLTQEQLAEKAHVSFAVVSRTERQQATPSLESLENLAKALGVSLGVLVGQEKAEALPYSGDATRIADILDGLPSRRRGKVRRAIEALLLTP